MHGIKRFLATLMIPFLFLSAGPAQALDVGEQVMAEWPENRCWYHGVISEVRGAAYRVQFSDGDTALLPDNKVVRDRIRRGHRVQGRWQRGQKTYPGRINDRQGNDIQIFYDDGDREWTTMAYICVRRNDL